MAIRFFVFLLIFSLCGCTGILYTNITLPYTKNFEHTPVGSKSSMVKTHIIQVPLKRGSLLSAWDRGVIVNACREAGIKEVYYADVRILSLLFGIYRRETLILYGE